VGKGAGRTIEMLSTTADRHLESSNRLAAVGGMSRAKIATELNTGARVMKPSSKLR
jgi:hypothetical protein